MSHNPSSSTRRTLWPLWIIGGLVVLALLGWLLGPMVINAAAPGRVAASINADIPGHVALEGVRASWSGPIVIERLSLFDDQGEPVAHLRVSATKGLWAFLWNRKQLGRVTLAGDVMLERDAEGRSNLQRALEAPDSHDTNDGLPAGMQLDLVLERLDVTIRDASLADESGRPRVFVLKANGEGAFDTLADTLNVALNLDGTLGEEGTPASDVRVAVSAKRLMNLDGRLTLDVAEIDADVQADQVQVALLDALMGMGGTLGAALGEQVNLTATAKGEGDALLATATLEGERAQGEMDLRIRDGMLTLEQPGHLRLGSTAFLARLPGLGETLRGYGVGATPETSPGVTLRIDELLYPLGEDLRGMVVAMNLDIEEVRAVTTLPGETQARARVFRADPFPLRITTDAQSGDVAVSANLKTYVDGASDAEVEIDLTLVGLLDQQGRPAMTALSGAMGHVALKRVATSYLQPMLGDLDAAAVLGPTLDATINVATKDAGESADALPPMDLTLQATSERARLQGDFTLVDNILRANAPGPTLRLGNAGAVVAALAGEGGGVTFGRGGEIEATASELIVPLSPSGDIRYDALQAKVNALVKDLSMVVEQGNERIQIARAELDLVMTPGQPLKVDLATRMVHDGSETQGGGTFTVAGLVRVDPDGRSHLTPAAARPQGSMQMTGFPTALLGQPMLVALAGPTADLNLEADATSDDETVLKATLKNNQFEAVLDGTRRPDVIEIKTGSVNASLTPAVAAMLLKEQGVEMDANTRLRAPARLQVDLEPLRLPLDSEGQVVWDKAGTLSAALAIPGKAEIEGLQMEGQDGAKTTLPPLGVEDVKAALRLPLAAMAPQGTARHTAVANFSGRLLLDSEPRGALQGNIETEMLQGAPSGAMDGKITLAGLDPATLDLLMQTDGMLAGLLGGKLDLEVLLTQAATAQALQPDMRISLSSPNLKTAAPIRLVLREDRISLPDAAKFTWSMTPEWGTRTLFQGGPPTLNDPVAMTIDLTQLTLSRGEGTGLLKPGVFSIGLRASAPALSLAVNPQQTLNFANLNVALQDGAQQGTLDFTARMDGKGSDADPMDLKGSVTGFADSNGNSDLANAAFSMQGTVPAFPTEVLDNVAQQDGLLLDALGPAVTLNIDTDGFSRHGGTFRARAESERALAVLNGRAADGVFTADEDTAFTMNQISTTLGQRVPGSTQFGWYEKLADYGPMRAQAGGLQVPLDGDMSKLNGRIEIIPGRVHFMTAAIGRRIIAPAVQQDAENNPRELDPFTVRIQNGVASFEQMNLALGRFTASSGGTVDLVRERLDILTMAPAGALNRDFIAPFLGQLPGLTDNTMIPLRTRGSFADATPTIDSGMLLQEAGRGAVGGLLERVLTGRDGQPAPAPETDEAAPQDETEVRESEERPKRPGVEDVIRGLGGLLGGN